MRTSFKRPRGAFTTGKRSNLRSSCCDAPIISGACRNCGSGETNTGPSYFYLLKLWKLAGEGFLDKRQIGELFKQTRWYLQ